MSQFIRWLRKPVLFRGSSRRCIAADCWRLLWFLTYFGSVDAASLLFIAQARHVTSFEVDVTLAALQALCGMDGHDMLLKMLLDERR